MSFALNIYTTLSALFSVEVVKEADVAGNGCLQGAWEGDYCMMQLKLSSLMTNLIRRHQGSRTRYWLNGGDGSQ